MASRCFPSRFEGSFSAFKERQLLFALTRQLAKTQFLLADRSGSERLWQEAAAEEMDPERIVALLYGVADHDDEEQMEAVDRPYREQQRRAERQARSPFRRLARLTQARPGRSRGRHDPSLRHQLR